MLSNLQNSKRHVVYQTRAQTFWRLHDADFGFQRATIPMEQDGNRKSWLKVLETSPVATIEVWTVTTLFVKLRPVTMPMSPDAIWSPRAQSEIGSKDLASECVRGLIDTKESIGNQDCNRLQFRFEKRASQIQINKVYKDKQSGDLMDRLTSNCASNQLG